MAVSAAAQRMDPVRVPPHRERSERAIVGAALHGGDDGAAAGYLVRVVPADWFYLEANRAIWQVMLDLVDLGRPVDAVSVADELAAQGIYDRCGGAPYLDACLDALPFRLDADGHAALVRDAAAARGVILDCSRIIGSAFDGTTPLDLSLDLSRSAERCLLGPEESERGEGLGELLDEKSSSARRPVSLDVIGYATVEQAETCDFGARLGPLWPGQYMAILAKGGTGKTSAVVSWTLGTAIGGTPVGHVSIEDSRAELDARRTSMLTWAGHFDVQRGARSAADRDAFERCRDRLRQIPLWTAWIPGADRRQVAVAIRKLVMRHGCRLIVVDYLQRIKGDRRESEYDRLGNNLREIEAALGSDAAGILVSQVSRRSKGSDDPGDYDARGSGEIEEHARKVLVLIGEKWDGSGVTPVADADPPRALDTRAKGLRVDVVKNTNRECWTERMRFYYLHSLVWPGGLLPPWAGSVEGADVWTDEVAAGPGPADDGPPAPECDDEEPFG